MRSYDNTPDSKVHGANMGPGDNRTQVGPMLGPWTLLSGTSFLTLTQSPRDRLNRKTPSYQYRKSHYNDKTVSWPPYLYNGNHIPRTTGFILRRDPVFVYSGDFDHFLQFVKKYLSHWDCFLQSKRMRIELKKETNTVNHRKEDF